MKMEDLIERVQAWSTKRGIYKEGTVEGQFKKLKEEVEELEDSLVKGDIADVKDAIGDIQVMLINISEMTGLNVVDCLKCAYDEIKDRKGFIKNGIYVKTKEK